jgi:hypothetical protein
MNINQENGPPFSNVELWIVSGIVEDLLNFNVGVSFELTIKN